VSIPGLCGSPSLDVKALAYIRSDGREISFIRSLLFSACHPCFRFTEIEGEPDNGGQLKERLNSKRKMHIHVVDSFPVIAIDSIVGG
jgi:hypothetical protein